MMSETQDDAECNMCRQTDGQAGRIKAQAFCKADLMRSESLMPRPSWKLYTDMLFNTESGLDR